MVYAGCDDHARTPSPFTLHPFQPSPSTLDSNSSPKHQQPQLQPPSKAQYLCEEIEELLVSHSGARKGVEEQRSRLRVPVRLHRQLLRAAASSAQPQAGATLCVRECERV
eukprot:249734-Rhodomonas_salina.5